MCLYNTTLEFPPCCSKWPVGRGKTVETVMGEVWPPFRMHEEVSSFRLAAVSGAHVPHGDTSASRTQRLRLLTLSS